jgi:hypothetical protein
MDTFGGCLSTTLRWYILDFGGTAQHDRMYLLASQIWSGEGAVSSRTSRSFDPNVLAVSPSPSCLAGGFESFNMYSWIHLEAS